MTSGGAARATEALLAALALALPPPARQERPAQVDGRDAPAARGAPRDGSARTAAVEPPVPQLDFLPTDSIPGHLFEGAFVEPGGLCFDRAAKELLVVDSKSGLVGIFDADGVPRFAFGGPPLLTDPQRIAVEPGGSILVMAADRGVAKRFNYRGEPRGALRFSYPAIDGKPEGIARLAAIAVGPDGSIVVADQEPPQLLLYDREGTFRRCVRSAGKSGPAFETIMDVAVAPDGTIAVCDFRATPIQIFDRAGNYLRGFGERNVAREDFTAPVAVALDDAGLVFAVDLLRHDVKVFTREGRFVAVFGGWLSPRSGGRSPGELLYPTGVAIESDGRVCVSERYGRRVQLFRRQPRGDARGLPALAIPPRDGERRSFP